MSELIKKQDYHTYFDDISKFFEDDLVEIKVIGLKLGDQVEADYIALKGITYENKADEIYLYLDDGLEHVIRNPVDVYVDEGEFGLNEIVIKCAHGHLHLVKFKHAIAVKKWFKKSLYRSWNV